MKIIIKETNPTTLFLDSYELMETIIKDMGKEYSKSTLFFIRANTKTATYDRNTKTIIPNHNTDYYLQKGINMVFTTVPSTEIDKSLSDEEPMG